MMMCIADDNVDPGTKDHPLNDGERKGIAPDSESPPPSSVEDRLFLESLEIFRRVPTLCLGSICDG